jgi:uncharacterized protein (TIGR03435 family)
MKRLLASLGCAILWCGIAPAQSSDTPTAFEAADIHSTVAGVLFSTSLSARHGRVEMHGATLVDLVSTAYQVDREKVFGGPAWVDADRFEVIAKTDPSVSQDVARILLRALLADRFQLAIHTEDKPMPVFVLLPGKKVALKQSTGEGPANCKRGGVNAYQTLECHNMTIAGLAELLPQTAPGYFNHPVVDRTGLSGAYDFTLKWTGRSGLGATTDPDNPPISLFDFFDKQMGIKVEPQTQPSSAIVIDHVNRTPTPNDPDIAARIPPAPAEFEVAEVRPSKADAPQSAKINNGRMEVFAWPMKTSDIQHPGLINYAYGPPGDGIPVIGGDKWLESDRFDIIAKASPDTSVETLQLMLRNLLIQRFRLAVHEEKQPQPVYALTAPKGAGKLKPSDGASRTGCHSSPADGAILYTCRNTTMAQFAERLPSLGAGYLDHPMVDLTELKGAYDFEITFAIAGRAYGYGGRGGDSRPAAPAGDAVTPSAPTGGITLFEAIDKQLGLKLAPQKVPMPVIVIDHINRTLTDQ